MEDVVLIALVFQSELVFERELCLGVVVHLKLDLLADFGGSAQLNVLVEVEVGGALLCHGERRVAAALVFNAECHVGRTLQLDVDGVAAEYLVEHLTSHVNWRDERITVAVAYSRLATVFPVVFYGLAGDVVGVLLLGHVIRVLIGEIADFTCEDILSGDGVVLYGVGDVGRLMQGDACLVGLSIGSAVLCHDTKARTKQQYCYDIF